MPPLKIGWKLVGAPKMPEPVEPDRKDEHADQRADNVELAFAQCRRAEEHSGEGVQQIAVGRAQRAAAE